MISIAAQYLRSGQEFRLDDTASHLYRYVKRLNQSAVRAADEDQHGTLRAVTLRKGDTVWVPEDEDGDIGPITEPTAAEPEPEPEPNRFDFLLTPALVAAVDKAEQRGYQTTPAGDPATVMVRNGKYVVTGGAHLIRKCADGWDIFTISHDNGHAYALTLVHIRLAPVWSAAMKAVAR